MNNFWQRTFTGISFALIILVGMWWHKNAYLVIFSAIVFLAMLELVKMINATTARVQTVWVIVLGLYWFISSFFVLSGDISPIWLLVSVPLISAVFITELFRKVNPSFLNIASTLIIPIYVALPFSFLHYITLKSGSYDYLPLMGFFLLTWSNDSGAYLIGSNFGKRKLFPRVSPNKSWEGVIGGLVFTVAGAFLISKIDHANNFIYWAGAGIVVSVMGTFGDLAESMIKRSVSVKDSGNLLPGHGGLLDRFDAVIFAAPFVSCYFIVARYLMN